MNDPSCLANYTEHRGVLVKKYRSLFAYIFVIEEKGTKIKVNVGKGLYHSIAVGSRLTVGKIGRKLINIRPGYAVNSDGEYKKR